MDESGPIDAPDGVIALGIGVGGMFESLRTIEAPTDVQANALRQFDKMIDNFGKLVRLGGDFRVWKEDKLDYVGVANARVLFTDYYWTAGASNLPMPLGMSNFSDTTMQAGPFVQTQPTSYPASNPAPPNQ